MLSKVSIARCIKNTLGFYYIGIFKHFSIYNVDELWHVSDTNNIIYRFYQ